MVKGRSLNSILKAGPLAFLLFGLGCENEQARQARELEVIRISNEKLASENKFTGPSFKASQPKMPIFLRCTASLASYYNYMFSKSAFHYRTDPSQYFYSIEINIGNENNSGIHGYIEKNSEAGEGLFNLLKDGKTHPVELSIGYLNGDTGNGDVCKIFGFFGEYWAKEPTEYLKYKNQPPIIPISLNNGDNPDSPNNDSQKTNCGIPGVMIIPR